MFQVPANMTTKTLDHSKPLHLYKKGYCPKLEHSGPGLPHHLQSKHKNGAEEEYSNPSQKGVKLGS